MARLQLGIRLRELRASAGVSDGAAAAALQTPVSEIRSIESGLAPAGEKNVASLLALYGADVLAEQETLLALARLSQAPARWDETSSLIRPGLRRQLALEAEASVIMSCDSLLVPALLQTSDYAALSNELDTESHARRCAVLEEADPPVLWALIHETVLFWAPGGRQEVLQAQIRALRAATDKHNITVQVLSAEPGAAGPSRGPFSILRFASDGADDAVFDDLDPMDTPPRSAAWDQYHMDQSSLALRAISPGETRIFLNALAGKNG